MESEVFIMKKPVKITLIVIAIILALVILTVGGYFIYVFSAFHRLGDAEIDVSGKLEKSASVNKEYKIVSFNIGFGAYEPDYGFFMDGGTESRAWSKERLDKNMKAIASFLKGQNADFLFVQEVDFDSTRSYGFDEREYLLNELGDKTYTFAQNFDSPYLFYPIFCPHGIARSGIMTFSSSEITYAQRVELPIEDSLMKLVDLDRCYSKNYVKVDNGKNLVLYDFHLSAYTSDGKVVNEQLDLLLSDMEKEYKLGNYCIAGGDFNKDILGDSSVYFGKADQEYTWAQPIPEDVLKKYSAVLVAPLDASNPVPTCRNADGPYHKGQFVLTIDGFLVSPNVESKSAAVLDTQFAYSDHNPVEMIFELK